MLVSGSGACSTASDDDRNEVGGAAAPHAAHVPHPATDSDEHWNDTG